MFMFNFNKEIQKVLTRNPQFDELVKNYAQQKNEHILFKEKMSEILKEIKGSYTHGYYQWVYANLDTYPADYLLLPESYEASCEDAPLFSANPKPYI